MAKKHPQFRMLNDDILFQFEQESTYFTDKKITQKGFKEVTDWGLIIVSPTTNAESARWGVVVAVGPDCGSDLRVGRRIFIEKLMWTNGITYEGQEYWKTTEEKVLAVDSSED